MSGVNGLVLGKFLPPHKGHEYLVEFAKNHVKKLFIVVDHIADDVIPVAERMAWMKEICPEAEVLTLQHPLPQSPKEALEDFWQLWEEGLKAVLPEPIDLVFASELYGETLASVLGARFEMVDLDRKRVPVSATQIRQAPWEHWALISDTAKPFYCKKVCVFGPESVGKSTLTKQLAQHYHTVFVPEYARTVIEAHAGDITFAEMEKIADGHRDAIAQRLPMANRLLFVDTDAITTKIWSNELFGRYPDCLDSLIETQVYDLYLLLDVDVPWVKDIVRYRPEAREQFFETCRHELEKYQRNYVVISGDWQARFEQATRAVDRLIQSA